MPSSTANPLLTLPTHHSLLEVKVDNVPVTALIDTGAHLSIMSAPLRRRLQKIMTPSTTQTIRVADGGAVQVIGMCTARVSIAGRHTVVLFAVLAHCPHDLILGLDFLSAHSAELIVLKHSVSIFLLYQMPAIRPSAA